MHSILFEAKRAFHASLYRLSQPMLAPYGVTAARFDLLYALFGDPGPGDQLRGEGRPMLQSTLRRHLGVSRTTVSRMVRALEGLGLVRRWPARGDTRQRWLVLTLAGVDRVQRILVDLVSRGIVDLSLDRALAGKRWHAAEACLAAKESFDDVLHRFRAALGDAACLVYPWHPDD